MKITAQTADELALKDGDAKSVVVGIIVLVVGIAVMFYERFAPSPALWIALVLCVVGIGAIFISSSIAVDINKTTGQIAYRKKRLIGGSAATYAVGDVLRIETRKSWRMEGGTRAGNTITPPRQVLISQSVMVFKDGRELPLDHQSGGSGMSIGPAMVMGGSGNETALANQVATFLGVPFQEIAPPGGPIGINIGGGTGIQL
ncbi:MAG TPA: hypothetical protein VMA75_04195 [Candidatus Paceibacterota bacterium]|nr:hypothetical protein [Candidatus Paceibacterota bacterium]